MPVVAAAVCPHPPAIVPQLTRGAAGELDPLRRAADEAVAALLTAEADARFVVGPAATTVRFGAPASGSFAAWGVPLRVGGAQAPGRAAGDPVTRAAGDPGLPLSLTVGAWLLERAGGAPAAVYHAVASDADPATCAALGAELAAAAGRVALLVMGDGSARRGAGAPGGDDPRAAGFDAAVAGALAAGDPAALLALPVQLARQLLVGGLPAWQVLAGAFGTDPVRATLRYDDAPYGVGYFVATWETAHGR